MSKSKENTSAEYIKRHLPKIINSKNNLSEFNEYRIIISLKRLIKLPSEFIDNMIIDIMRNLISLRINPVSTNVIKELIHCYLIKNGYKKEGRQIRKKWKIFFE